MQTFSLPSTRLRSEQFLLIFELLYRHVRNTEMQKILSDTNKFVKVSFNSKHKVNKEIRHLLDIELSIKIV